ncbi:DUF3618 domain-containing protein [Streptomyces sp. JH34]|uniref:DUF3618 domain-containing protein n=1 Tax=Streptomyces sp. JH34 TaxID=2793633 RepID=UPI0023F8BBCE|nr:DUF3618 domain-containing protein [Streptomyces sp. JH34]MDF6017256.1 DUF3618 domain-containing protein [Streptomyces sp. JH34]
MKEEPRADIGTPVPDASSPEELREQAERTRDRLGRTVEGLATEADVKAQVKEKSAAARNQASEKAAQVADQIRGKAEQAAELMKDRTPDPVLEKTARAAAQVRETASKAGQYAAEKAPDPLREKAGRTASAARANRKPLLAGGALLAVVLLVRRARGRR